jgi:hypothetical protein
MLKLFLFLPIGQTLVLVNLFFLEYHVYGYLAMSGNYQNHVVTTLSFLGVATIAFSLNIA